MTDTENKNSDEASRYRRHGAAPDEPVANRFSRESYVGRRSASGPSSGHAIEDMFKGDPLGEREVYDEAGYWSEPRQEYSDGVLAENVRQRKEKEARPPKSEQLKHKRERSAGKTVLVVLLAILLAFGGWLVYLDRMMHIDDPALDAALTGTIIPTSPYYMVIAGSDAREDEASRTDTLLLARIDPMKKQATLVSIPRDTRVYLEGYGYSKINAAHAYGGPALTVQAVSEFAGVKISHYVEVGFEGFADIVDAAGGVTVDVPADTVVDDVALPEGVQKLDGEEALVFVRCRKTYALGDFQRAANQRQFMTALAHSIKTAPFYRWPFIVNSIGSCVSTDLHSWSMLGLGIGLVGIDTESMYTTVVPSTTGTIDGVSYVLADDAAWAQMMARVDAGLDPNS